VGQVLAGKLLLFDALSVRFTTIKLRGKAAGCVACGDRATISRATIASYDYAAFTGGQSAHDGPPPALNILPVAGRLSAVQLRQKLDQAATALAGQQQQQQQQQQATSGSSEAECGRPSANVADAVSVSAEDAAVSHAPDAAGAAGAEQLVKPLLLDVRPAEQFAIMSIPGAVNVPFLQLDQKLPDILRLCSSSGQQPTVASSLGTATSTAAIGGEEQSGDVTRVSHPAVYVLCRRGNHSQLAVQRLREAGVVQAVDVIGGYEAWAAQVDPGMPVL
jgi:adenylyltransferase/sulfurtransferase